MKIVMRSLLFVALIVVGSTHAAPSLPSQQTVAAFAQIPLMSEVALSPNGTHIAYLVMHEGRNHLAIQSLQKGVKRVIIPPQTNLEFKWLRWANADRLVYASYYADPLESMDTFERRYRGERDQGFVYQSRLISTSLDGKDSVAIIKPGSSSGSSPSGYGRISSTPPVAKVQDDVIDWLPADDKHILVSLDDDFDQRPEVRKVNIYTGDYEVVLKSSNGVKHWVADNDGDARLGHGETSRGLVLRVLDQNNKWVKVENADWLEKYQILGYADDDQSVYVRGPGDNGTLAIRKINPLTGNFVDTIFENDTYDVGGLLMDPSSNQAIGVHYTDDRHRSEYFDKTYRTLQLSLEKAQPGKTVKLLNMSTDQLKILVHIAAPNDPGEFFLWNRQTKSMSSLTQAMPGLYPELLSTPKAVSFKSRDGVNIPAYLTVPKDTDARNLATVVLVSGDGSERAGADFSYLTQFLVSRGYAVLEPNIRGTSGYGMDHRNTGIKQWGGVMQNDIVDAAKWLVKDGIADGSALCIIGTSYGGYAAAMAAMDSSKLFTCAASVNGLLNLPQMVKDKKKYQGGRYWEDTMGLEDQPLESVSPFHQAQRIATPMLIMQTRDDTWINPDQARGMHKQLNKMNKPAELIMIDSGDHKLDKPGAREKVLTSLEVFLDKYTLPSS